MSCDFKGTFTGVTELTTPPSKVTFMVWCDEEKLIAGCHEADTYVLGECPVCKEQPIT
jgi:hypothetical protein